MKCTSFLSRGNSPFLFKAGSIRHTNMNRKWNYLLQNVLEKINGCACVCICWDLLNENLHAQQSFCAVQYTAHCVLSLADPLLSLDFSPLTYFRVTSTFLSLLCPLFSLARSQGTLIVAQYNWIPFSFHFLSFSFSQASLRLPASTHIFSIWPLNTTPKPSRF